MPAWLAIGQPLAETKAAISFDQVRPGATSCDIAGRDRLWPAMLGYFWAILVIFSDQPWPALGGHRQPWLTIASQRVFGNNIVEWSSLVE